MKKKDLEWGIVKIITGKHRGRIGCYDDDGEDDKNAIIYFGHPYIAKDHYEIPLKNIENVTTDDLMKRCEEILQTIGMGVENISKKKRN